MKKLLEKYELRGIDLVFMVLMTVIGLAIRLTVRTVTTVDWTMYWDPWLAV